MLNRIQLIGRLGRDPEIRCTADGKTIARPALATSESYKEATTGERRKHTEWHRIVLFGRPAEVAEEFLKTGALVYVDGKLHTRKWQNRSGQDQFTTEIVGNELILLDRKPAQPGTEAKPTEDDDAFDDIPF